MGFFSKVFGKGGGKASRGAYKTCGKCGAPIQVSSHLMNIMTDTIDKWSIEGMSGYCGGCNQYLCSKHLEFKNTTGQAFGPWQVACKSCGVGVSTGP